MPMLAVVSKHRHLPKHVTPAEKEIQSLRDEVEFIKASLVDLGRAAEEQLHAGSSQEPANKVRAK